MPESPLPADQALIGSPAPVSSRPAKTLQPEQAAPPPLVEPAPPGALAKAVQESPGVAEGPAGRGTLLMTDDSPAPKAWTMASLYPCVGEMPEVIRKGGKPLSQFPVGKMTGHADNVAQTVQIFRDNHPDVLVYPPERKPFDHEVIMDLRYTLIGEDRNNPELLKHLDAERDRVIKYWYDR